MYTENDFDKVWEVFSEMGNVDGLGGNEYRVTKDAWIKAGSDNPPRFILIDQFVDGKPCYMK